MAEPTSTLLKVRVTVSPGWKPPLVTVNDVPGAACATENDNADLPGLTVNELVAFAPLGCLATTAYCPGARFGTLKLKLKLPSAPTGAVPTDVPLNVTSTFSAALKPDPLAVTWSPGTPAELDMVRLAVVTGVPGVAVPVPWPSAVAGSSNSAPRTRARTRTSADPMEALAGTGRDELFRSVLTSSPQCKTSPERMHEASQVLGNCQAALGSSPLAASLSSSHTSRPLVGLI